MIGWSGEIFGKDIILPHFIVNLSKPSSLGGGGDELPLFAYDKSWFL